MNECLDESIYEYLDEYIYILMLRWIYTNICIYVYIFVKPKEPNSTVKCHSYC